MYMNIDPFGESFQVKGAKMNKNEKQERPEVYALRQDSGTWQVSRRDFLKAAGLGAAVMGMGMNTRFVKLAHAASDLETLCKSAPAHQNEVQWMKLSPDGKYLFSCDTSGQQKCWNFASHALLKSEKTSVNDPKFPLSASIDGKSVVFMTKNTSISMLEFPELAEIGTVEVKPGNAEVKTINGLDVDSAGNIYGVSDGSLFKLTKTGNLKYSDQKVLYEKPSGSGTYKAVRILAEDSFLFVLKDSGFGIYDIQSGTMNDYGDGDSFYDCAVLPGGAKVLLCENKGTGYRLVSTVDGHVIWENELDQTTHRTAVTPDGSYGIIAAEKGNIALISMKDGAVIRRIAAGESIWADIVIAKDGTACAVAAGKSILFISLPDLEIIGCPVDLKEMKDDTKGIEVKGTDPATGQTVTYTLPCGSPIPEGAVCVCNCVAGEVCSCVGHVVCTCDAVCSCVGNTYTYCSCDTVCTCEGDGHYWYPD